MRKPLIKILLILLLLFSGLNCSTYTGNFQKFQPVTDFPKEKALIYVFRLDLETVPISNPYSRKNFPVHISKKLFNLPEGKYKSSFEATGFQKKQMGNYNFLLPRDTYYPYLADPGELYIYSHIPGLLTIGYTKLNAEPGKAYYVSLVEDVENIGIVRKRRLPRRLLLTVQAYGAKEEVEELLLTCCKLIPDSFVNKGKE